MTNPSVRRIHLRAALADLAGRPFVDLSGEDVISAGALRGDIARACPELRDMVSQCLLVAGDRVLSEEESVPPDGSLALVAPMRGG